MLVVFVLESSRSVACGICAEVSNGVMSYTALRVKFMRLWLASNVNALLVFLVTDLPLTTRMMDRASNVACNLPYLVGAAMLSSTKTRSRRSRYRLAGPTLPITVVSEATRVLVPQHRSRSAVSCLALS
jgi:hypothetical protein